MRLFTAVLPPAAVTDPLLTEVTALRKAGVGDPDGSGHWTDPAGWHLTLTFLGEVPDPAVPDLVAALEAVGAAHAPFASVLRGAGVFGGRSLWAGVGGDVASLTALAAAGRSAAEATGVPADAHTTFTPHLTLARLPDPEPARAALEEWEGREWTVPEFALVRSRLRDGDEPGPRYEALARLPLIG
ncbi:RNA 2',3'-cyclic phosphodiesterase [Streptomyces sp. BI20]|uniref:RNA 2',3'-cyclic phosphodiesterase n=1 Tax=Streptomyces sp. BI20 TaxID=3403460 RepID=UPI003C731EE6